MKKTVETQTMTKLAELALDGHVPDAMASRAGMLARIFRKSLPRDFEHTIVDFQARTLRTNVSDPEPIQVRLNIVMMLAEFPSQRQQILTDLLVYFPGDAELIQELRQDASA